MTESIYLPASSNLSLAWAGAFLHLMTPGVREIMPLVVTVTDFDDGIPQENAAIRGHLDSELAERGLATCHSVANTIFPLSLWNPDLTNDAEELFERYDRIWSRVKRHPANRRGVYFRRLTAYQALDVTNEPVNQLLHIINTYKGGNRRRSALQACVFDPTRDHSNSPRLGFPCLQQVTFTPIGEDQLSVTGVYAMQYVVERAYGNYLGLCRLGKFMAKQMDRALTKLTCIATVAQRGNPTKGSLEDLANAVRGTLAEADGSHQ